MEVSSKCRRIFNSRSLTPLVKMLSNLQLQLIDFPSNFQSVTESAIAIFSYTRGAISIPVRMDTCYPNNPNNRGDDSFAGRVRATSIQKSKRLFRGLASATGAPYPVFLFRADQHRHFPRISSRHWQAPPLLDTVAYVSYLTMGMTFTHLFRETTRFTAN